MNEYLNCNQVKNEYDIILFSGIHFSFNLRTVAIYRLASHLRNLGLKVKTIDYFNFLDDTQIEEIINLYISKKTLIAGFSATVMLDPDTGDFFGMPDSRFFKIIKLIKAVNPGIKIVAGGGQFNNADSEMIKKYENVLDFISIGQGENTLLAIFQHLSVKEKLITHNIQKPFIVKDSSYPYNDFNVSRNHFIADDLILPTEPLPLELARGCVFKCKFCSYDLTNKNFMDYTKNKSCLKLELLENYEKYQTQHYYVVDDLINDSSEKIDMLYEISQELPFRLFLSGYIRLDLLWRYKDMAQKLKDIGLVSAFIGIETINDRSGRIVGKGLGKQRIEEALEHCSNIWKGDVHVEAHFIIGLPNDNTDTVTELTNWTVKQFELGRIHKAIAQPLNVNPSLGKSDIDKNPDKFGYEILKLEYNRNTPVRYATKKASWKLKNGYTWEQAVIDTNQFNAEMTRHSLLRFINAFNICLVPFLLARKFNKINIVHVLTGKCKLTDIEIENLASLILDENQERISQYYNKLINNR
jgi:hypothetical protein